MNQTSKKVRLQSLDVLRGFDMFWIMGGSHLLIALLIWLGLPVPYLETVSNQFKHAAWSGFNFYDLIFPLFVFMSGITIPFSHYSAINKGATAKTIQLKVIKRGVLLILIGMGFTFFKMDISVFKPYTVLGLIGGSYMIGASFCIYLKKPAEQLAIIFGILVAYHFCFYWDALPGNHDGLITPSKTFASFVDRHLLPYDVKLHMGIFDPEGVVRYFSGSCLCILGCVFGTYIKSQPTPNAKCSLTIFVSGILALGIGLGWNEFLPIIKPLWTPSYVVFAAGWSLILLSIFYHIIDVMQWTFFNILFLPIGMNSITIYVGARIINFNHTNEYFLQGIASTFEANSEKLILVFGLVAIQWLFLYFLYRNKLFLKV